jgi:predicted dehydrogenase
VGFPWCQRYASYAFLHPELCKIVAIAEPRPRTRNLFVESHNLPESSVFDSWKALHEASGKSRAESGKPIADAVLVTVQDKMHMEVVLAFAEQGYNILCEKPMATTPEECIRMAGAVKKGGKVFGMGHGKFNH